MDRIDNLVRIAGELTGDQYDTLRLLVQTEISRHVLAGSSPPRRLEDLRGAITAAGRE